jgi:hypothetical protein
MRHRRGAATEREPTYSTTVRTSARVEPCPSDRASTAGTCPRPARARAATGRGGNAATWGVSAEARPPPPRACRAPPPTPPVFPADRADPLPLPPPVSDRNARMDGARAAVRPATWRGAVDRIGPHASRARRGVRRRSLLFELPHAPN